MYFVSISNVYILFLNYHLQQIIPPYFKTFFYKKKKGRIVINKHRQQLLYSISKTRNSQNKIFDFSIYYTIDTTDQL